MSAAVSDTIALINGAGNTAIWSSLTGDLTTLSATLTSYISHSDRLSGVVLGATGPSGEPGLNGLIGIAKAYNSVCESVTGGTKDNFSPIFNSILGPGSAQLNTEKQKIVNRVKNFILTHQSLGSANSGFNVELAGHITTVKASKDIVATLITNDNSAYDTASLTVRNYNLGNVLMSGSNDPCFTDKLISHIASSSMKEKLDNMP